MGDEANLSKQAAADRAERYVREQLNPAPGEEYRSPLAKKRREFVEQLNTDLNRDPYYNNQSPEGQARRQAKLEQATRDFDTVIVEKARAGATEGGDALPYLGEAEKRQKDTSTGLIRGVINTVVGGLGGIFGFLWDLLKHLPIVGDMIASIGDKRAPEEKARGSKAAGVASALGEGFEIHGVAVEFTARERKNIFEDLRKPEAQNPAQPATTTVPAATPESNPPSPEVLLSARDAATPARTAGANDPRDVGLNGGLPPAPLVAVAVANNATGPTVG